MSVTIRASTRVLAVLGDPVGHSLSPSFQNAAIQSAGLDGVYVAIRCSAAQVEGVVRGLSWDGGGGNVTIPHKRRVAELLSDPDESVIRTGACNTFWGADGEIHGTNTDVVGVRAAVRSLLGESASGARVVLLGAGGSARAAAVALLDDGAHRIEVANRSRARATALISSLGDDRVVEASSDEAQWSGADLWVHATPLGLRPADPLRVQVTPLLRPKALLDLVYVRHGTTALVDRARAAGVEAADGREMLLNQGAASFETWWGIPAPMAAMRQALDAAAGPA